MHTHHSVDNSDWLKTTAIILVVVDHTGYFFIEDADWWSVFGRMAAPTFFFLLGYAQTRTVPFHWVWLGIILTLLDSWNNGWTWMAANILFSLALIRITRPYVQNFLQDYGWLAFIFFVSVLFSVLPIAANIVDYGAEGWLWALFGLYQRMYIDGKSAIDLDSTTQSSVPLAHIMTKSIGRMRLLACFAAAVIYVWQEQKEFSFSQLHFAIFVLGIGILSLSLCLFLRGPSRIQPPEFIASVLRFIGRHTLEIYAIQLAGSELLIKFVPSLAV